MWWLMDDAVYIPCPVVRPKWWRIFNTRFDWPSLINLLSINWTWLSLLKAFDGEVLRLLAASFSAFVIGLCTDDANDNADSELRRDTCSQRSFCFAKRSGFISVPQPRFCWKLNRQTKMEWQRKTTNIDNVWTTYLIQFSLFSQLDHIFVQRWEGLVAIGHSLIIQRIVIGKPEILLFGMIILELVLSCILWNWANWCFFNNSLASTEIRIISFRIIRILNCRLIGQTYFSGFSSGHNGSNSWTVAVENKWNMIENDAMTF